MRKPKPSAAQDDKKLQGALKKLNVQPITGVEEVNMFREDGNVLHFTAPKGESYSLRISLCNLGFAIAQKRLSMPYKHYDWIISSIYLFAKYVIFTSEYLNFTDSIFCHP